MPTTIPPSQGSASSGSNALVKASTDSPATVVRTANAFSAISVTPTSGGAQMTVSINGASAVTWPLGTGFQWDSGDTNIKNSFTITFTVTAGSFAVVERT